MDEYADFMVGMLLGVFLAGVALVGAIVFVARGG